jgi:MFS family permease
VVDAQSPLAVWRSVRAMPDFGRLLWVRIFSQFGDGLFAAGLAGAILFNPEREAEPWAIAASFAVLFLPYSLIGPFAGALLDRWDRRYVLIAANATRMVLIAAVGMLLTFGQSDLAILAAALIINGVSRFVASGLAAALPHVVPREKVVTMNSVATAVGSVAAFLGANFMLGVRFFFGPGDTGSAAVIFTVTFPVLISLLLAFRFRANTLGPDETARSIHGSAVYAVASGWLHGLRTVIATPSVAATLSGLAASRMVLGINTLMMLVLVRHSETPAVAGFGGAVLFVGLTGLGTFVATILTPALVRRVGRIRAANAALAVAIVAQLLIAPLIVPVMFACAFLLGLVGQVVKLCADSAMQIDVDDPLRGHVFTVQDSVFWGAFIAATAVAAGVIADDGRSPGLAVAGAAVYLAGLVALSVIGSRRTIPHTG